MGAQHSRDIPENEFIFENPLLTTTTTFQLPPKEDDEIPKKLSEKERNKPESVSTFPAPLKSKELEEENTLEYEKTENAKDAIENIEPEIIEDIKKNNKQKNIKETNFDKIKNNKEIKDNKIKNTKELPIMNEELKEEVKEEIKKEKKKKFKEEPLPTEDTYKPLNLEKADQILSPEILEEIIEEHVKEEIHNIQNEPKIRNFKRDKLLERTINTIKYGNSNLNYKDINDKYRKSQRKVLECMSNNDSCTLSERDSMLSRI